jgi:glycosyltransferase involved in cell wall biosynthesis
MSCSCAVISTAAGGIGQVIQNGKSGFTCGVDAYRDLEEIAGRLLTDNEERGRLGEGARSRVQEAFSIEEMVDQIEQLYEYIH